MTNIENVDVPGVSLPDYKPNKNSKEANVSTPCHEYEEMAERWELLEDLMGGTPAMRKAGKKWLAQEPREDNKAYENRLNRTVLYNAYKRSVTTLAGLPFTTPASVENVPQDLEYLLEDIDSTGTDITNLGFSLLKDQVHLGLTHILVDMPAIQGKVDLEQQKSDKIRPYFSHITPLNLISWKARKQGGKIVLTEIRIKEEIYEPNGEWGEKEVKQIRVVTPESFEIHRKKDKKWVITESLPNNIGYIPLITIYGNKTGFMTAEPSMEDLAWLNLRHYQKLSDHDNILHVVSVPILYGAGFADGVLDGVSLGPNTLVTNPEPNSTLTFVEHSGSAIDSAEKSLERLEERMAALGADLIIRKSVDRQTATSRKIDQSESISMLQVMVNNLESGLQQAFKVAGEWLNMEVEVDINIGDSLNTGELGANTLDVLAQFIIDNGGMNIEQAVTELRRRGVLTDTYKVDKDKVQQVLKEKQVQEPVKTPATTETVTPPGETP